MKHFLFAAIAVTASTGALSAQTASETIIDRVQQPAPPPGPGTATAEKPADEKGDLDGGTQRLAETRKRPFKLTLGYDVQVYYTSNVFLAPSNAVESVIVANTVQARADFDSITAGQALITPSAGFAYQRYNHALGTGDQARQNLDFDAYSVPLNLRVRFGQNWEASLGVTGTAVYSLEGPPDYNLTYQSIATAASLRKLIAVGRDQILTFGAGINYVKTKTDVPVFPLNYREDRNDKIDTSLDVGYYYLKNKWVLGSYARIVNSDYVNYQESGSFDVDRQDLTVSIGASATYNINRWAAARAFISADHRDPQGSSIVSYRYENANAGVGLSLTAGF